MSADRTMAVMMLCCLVPVMLVVGFVGWTVIFNETWNRILDRVFPGRSRSPPGNGR